MYFPLNTISQLSLKLHFKQSVAIHNKCLSYWAVRLYNPDPKPGHSPKTILLQLIIHHPTVCMHARSPQSWPTLCDPMDNNLPGSSVHGILQARILEWVAMGCPPGDLPDPGTEPPPLISLLLAGGFFTLVPPGKPHYPTRDLESLVIKKPHF